MYKSNASWTKIDDSNDEHECLDDAVYVCRALKQENTVRNPCSIRGICLGSWVTDENNNVVYVT